jgi:hypothetical protein
MATTDVQVCNRALRHCRGPRITSLNDASEAARACKEVYDDKRRALLEGHPWNFAMLRGALTPEISEAPVYEFDNTYLLPGGCLALRDVDGYFKAKQYQVEAGRILINDSGPLYIKYTSDATADKFSPLFAEALALSVAIDVLPTVQNSNVKRETLQRMFGQALGAAKRTDALQNPPDEPVDDEWDLARLA